MKKKFLALGMTLLAGLTLASCGEDTKATTTETYVLMDFAQSILVNGRYSLMCGKKKIVCRLTN